MATGLLVLPITAKIEQSGATPLPLKGSGLPASDLRTERLQKFFAKLHCPVLNLAEDFIHAADDNHLDWRLLPSISVIESSGGKAYRNNNIFGWDNPLQAFPSIRVGLNVVAFKLGKSPLYRDRDVPGKLRLYNPDQSYASRVMSVMKSISPVAELTPAERLIRRQNEYVYVAN